MRIGSVASKGAYMSEFGEQGSSGERGSLSDPLGLEASIHDLHSSDGEKLGDGGASFASSGSEVGVESACFGTAIFRGEGIELAYRSFW